VIKAKAYKGQVVHLFGSINEYVGELDTKPHKNGPGWYRILNPCVVFQQSDPQKGILTNVLMALTGPGNAYKKYVDIRIPDDFVIEIRTVNKSGNMYEFYKKEIDRVVANRIIIPDGSNVVPLQ